VKQKIRILIADDHTLFREGLQRLFGSYKDLSVVATAENGAQAIKMAEETHPDVSLLDISMPDIDGIEVAQKIKASCPETAVVMLTAYKDENFVKECIQLKVEGYLLKNAHRNDLINAIRMVNNGDGVFNLDATRSVLSGMAGMRHKEGSSPRLSMSKRELDVLGLLSKGLTNKEIGERLFISQNTVRTHLVNIFRTIGVKTRTEASAYALKNGIGTVDEAG